MRRQLVFLISLALALLTISGAWAQDATPAVTPAATEAAPTQLSYGTPVQGMIDDANYQQSWPLTTASADRIQVTVTRTSGNLIPGITILDADGQTVAQSYGADKTYAAAQIDDTTLSAAGDYTVQVDRDGDQDGKTSGGYTLVVTPLGTGPDNPNNTTVIGAVQADTPVDGEITADHWLQLAFPPGRTSTVARAPENGIVSITLVHGEFIQPYIDSSRTRRPSREIPSAVKPDGNWCGWPVRTFTPQP